MPGYTLGDLLLRTPRFLPERGPGPEGVRQPLLGPGADAPPSGSGSLGRSLRSVFVLLRFAVPQLRRPGHGLPQGPRGVRVRGLFVRARLQAELALRRARGEGQARGGEVRGQPGGEQRRVRQQGGQQPRVSFLRVGAGEVGGRGKAGERRQKRGQERVAPLLSSCPRRPLVFDVKRDEIKKNSGKKNETKTATATRATATRATETAARSTSGTRTPGASTGVRRRGREKKREGEREERSERVLRFFLCVSFFLSRLTVSSPRHSQLQFPNPSRNQATATVGTRTRARTWRETTCLATGITRARFRRGGEKERETPPRGGLSLDLHSLLFCLLLLPSLFSLSLPL